MKVHESAEWEDLQNQAKTINKIHLKILNNENNFINLENKIFYDFSKIKINSQILFNFSKLFEKFKINSKIQKMFSGEKINSTENRSVLHTALRHPNRLDSLIVDGVNVYEQVHSVLDQIEDFSQGIRSGALRGFTNKQLKNLICVGIGGSYLGPEFVYEALRSDPATAGLHCGRICRFLANVDPIDVHRATEGLDPSETLVIVISKTFTTAETMLNARTLRDWVLNGFERGADDNRAIVNAHFVAVSTALEKTKEFGISRVFGFWDWVGGRFSVSSAVGVLPLAVHFGFPVVRKFLDGAHFVDTHFKNETNFTKNIPFMMGLISVWNSSFLGIESNAILPYCQSLTRFVAHIQQVDMESNGKRVDLTGDPVPFPTGQIIFGEPGTNGQHSFYQLLHQSERIVSCDFIGFKQSVNRIRVDGEPVTNHDELMTNFFAQPEALAFGQDSEDGHKHFPGDRPSVSLLLEKCDAWNVGCLLALYEHRTAVQSFIWNTNAFDQWGVELGKVLAKGYRKPLSEGKSDGRNNPLLEEYLKHSSI